MSETYTASGVSLDEGDAFSKLCGEICRGACNNSPYLEVIDSSRGHFRGPRGFRLRNLPSEAHLGSNTDGIGTKVLFIDLAKAWRKAAHDLHAMIGGDIIRYGGLPLALGNLLDVRTLGKAGDDINNAFRHVVAGLADIANKHHLVLLPGETAELGPFVGSQNPNPTAAFNWAGFGLGVYLPNRLITGETLAPGQAVIAL